MTLLEILQKFAVRTGVPKPVSGVSSISPSTQQMIGLLEEEIEELISRTRSQRIRGIATFNSVVGEDQGALDTLAGGPIERIVNDTIWNLTERYPVWGPTCGYDWQDLRAWTGASPRGWYRILNNHLMIRPTPVVATDQLSFEYVRQYGILDSAGTTIKQSFSNDADTCLFPDHLVLAGLRWRWKREKGLTYAEDKLRYEGFVSGFLEQDGTKPVVDFAALPDTWSDWTKPAIGGNIPVTPGDSGFVLIEN